MHYLDKKLTIVPSLCVLFILFFTNSSLSSTHQVKVHYAGLAFLGRYDYIQANYPMALSLNPINNSTQGVIDQAIFKQLKTTPLKNLALDLKLASLKNSDALVMAIAIDNEIISTEIHGPHTKVLIDLSAQILFFDYKNMSLVESHPVTFSLNHTVPKQQQLSKKQQHQLFQQAYLGQGHQGGFIHHIVKTLKNLSIAEAGNLHFQVQSVDVSKIRQRILNHRLPQQVAQYFGQYFSAQLAHQYSISVLPYVKGYAIGNTMAARVANGTVYQLKLPKADYQFNLHFLGMKKHKEPDSYLYSSKLRLQLKEPFLQKTYLNDDFRYAVYKPVQKTSYQLDDWPAYRDASENLIDELVQQLAKPNKKWIKTHARDKKSYRRFKLKQELFH